MELKYKSWDDITVKRYRDILAIDGDINTEEGVISTSIDTLAYLCGVSSEEVENLPIDEFTTLMAKAQFLRTIEESIIDEEIVINGMPYVLVTDMSQFIVSQYIDWQTLSIDPKNNLARLMGCILLPKGCDTYGKGYNLAKVVKDIDEHLPFLKAYSILRFFDAAQRHSACESLRLMSRMARVMELSTRDKMKKQRLRKERQIVRGALHYLGWS